MNVQRSFYADIGAGTIVRVRYLAPHAVATATSPTTGDAPLDVSFDGTGSTDWTGSADTLTYAWDLDGDGNYDDSASASPTRTYDVGTTIVRLRVSNNDGESDISDPIAIHAGNTAPTATIDTPASSLRWAAGDTVTFSGSATDPQDGTLGAANMRWDLGLLHCPSNCHTHFLRSWNGRVGDSFSAPDHQYPVTHRADADRHRLRGAQRLGDGLAGTRHRAADRPVRAGGTDGRPQR